MIKTLFDSLPWYYFYLAKKGDGLGGGGIISSQTTTERLLISSPPQKMTLNREKIYFNNTFLLFKNLAEYLMGIAVL